MVNERLAFLKNSCGAAAVWFDLALVGGAFEAIANALPFVHAVNAARFALLGDYAAIMPQLWWVLGYGVGLLALAALVVRLKIKGNAK